MTDTPNLLCIGSGWIAGRLVTHAAEARGWACRVAFQNFRNPSIPADWMFPMPRSHDEWIAVLSEYRPEYIVYLLGTSFVPEIESHLAKAIDDNVGTLARLQGALAASAMRVGKLLVVGSASVYRPSDGALREEDGIAPSDSYGLVKAVQERVALESFHRDAIPTVVARQFNTSGTGQNANFVLPSIARQVAQALRSNLGDRVVRLRIGDIEVRRDFLDVRDTVAAYCAILEQGTPGSTYNVCSGQARSIAELARKACELFGLEAAFDVQSSLVRQGERRRPVVLGDPARLRSLGWEPRRSADELIRDLVNWHLSTPVSE